MRAPCGDDPAADPARWIALPVGLPVSDPLDERTLGVINEMLSDGRTASVPVVRKLWKDRALLLDAAVLIRDWDYTHAEALSVKRVQSVLAEVLREIGE